MSRLAKSRGLFSDVGKYRKVETGIAKPGRKKSSKVPTTRVASGGVTDSSGNGRTKESVIQSPRQPLLSGSKLTAGKGGKLDR